MNLRGIFPPIATPFKDDEIDLDGMKTNVTKWMKTGLAGVLVLGSNGEAPMLDADESFRVAAAAREAVPSGQDDDRRGGRGVDPRHDRRREARRGGRRRRRAGAHALLLQEPDDDATCSSGTSSAVADASPVPVLPYNVPAFTGVNMAAEVVAKLSLASQHPGRQGLERATSRRSRTWSR